MNRSRSIFIGILAVVAVALGASAYIRYGAGALGIPRLAAPAATTVAQPKVQATIASVSIKPLATTEPGAAVATTAPQVEANGQNAAPPVAPSALGQRLKPVWGPNYKENDGLGKIVCGAYAFAGDYPLQQIQTAGLDVKRGFHLGIVPFYLNENYVVSAKDRTDAMLDGTLDCLLTTFDLLALENPGVITAFINESAGADQLWARDLKVLNDLKGKRIAFEANGPSEFFVLDLLATVNISPQEVTLLPQDNQGSAIDTFNKNEADAVAGWEPVILGAQQGNGKSLVTSKDFRSILGAVVMSNDAIKTKRTVIQLFHEAWFEAVSLQETNFDQSAKQIADWGNNEFLGVKKETAGDDLRRLLGGVAQANLTDNARAFAKVSSVIDRLIQTRKIWAAAGHTVPTNDVTQMVDPQFVQSVAAGLQLDLNAPNEFVNNSFSLGRSSLPPPSANAAAPAASAATTDTVAAAPAQPSLENAQAVATLPCSRFEFVPNTAQLQPQSEQLLRDCALRILQQNLTLFVRVKGSSAWPGPKGTIKQELVENTAKERAQAVVDFFVTEGISRDRFVMDWTLPPPDHRETTDLAKQLQDRYVEIALLSSGL